MIVVISDQARHFFQSLSMIGHCTSVIRFFRVCIVLPPGLPAKYPYDILQKQIIERELANKDESVAKKGKMIIPEVKFKPNVFAVIEEIADPGNADPAAVRETLCSQRNLVKGTLLVMNEESGLRYPRSSVTSKNPHIKRPLEDIS